MDSNRQMSEGRGVRVDHIIAPPELAAVHASALGPNIDAQLRTSPYVVYAVAIALGLAVFLIDAFAPVDVAVAVLYVVVVLLVASVASPTVTVGMAWACVSLTLLGFLLAQSDQIAVSSLARCIVSVIAIVTVSALALRNQSSRAMLQNQVDLLNLTHDAIVVYGLDGRVRFWSKGAERLYGWRAQEAFGEAFHELTRTGAVSPIAELIDTTIRDGSWQGELTRTRKNGETVLVSSRWIVSRDKSGQPIAILSTDSDITKAKSLEAELRRQKEELVATIDAIPAMVWSTAEDGRLLYLNRRWTDYDVRTRDGTNVWRDIVHPDDIATLEAAWHDAITSGSPFEVTVRVQLGSGEYRCMIIGAAPLRDGDGRIRRWYGVNTDIEARRQAEQALERSRAELAHVTRVTMLGELAASIAHEVTQPLAAIVTSGEAGLRWLNHDVPDLDEVRDSIEQMTDDARRATDIIRQIRAMAKRNDRDDARVDVTSIVEQSIDLMRRELQSHDVEVAQNCQPSLWVRGDRVQLQQVIINLLMNAVQAMSGVTDRRRTLAVSTRLVDGTSVQVRVDDAGHGIRRQDADSLFTPFFTTKKEGMGMGLSICRSIVEGHGGRIWAESQENEGTSMQFVLPVEGITQP
ncbi:PAS domain-containing sensor histidine kinase [Burkholderia cenocepacia]|jgi:PAS domain S-box-containing protein|uniref:histidine kinase n=1 Tax=Burkholderia cenocepacia (strain ATCC BAA-245 / DSM 16553 / LMG 16656 / NCTC 13227 / J2315 / CF5610) TaxID=216591 RepID=B4EP99_BURCJ|nr:PAS domain-containing sensor histidine kinase [Burkholderia cenocepacia]KIS51893.1 sensory box protein [Burkholderia cepacia]EPZ84981.1 PAS domain S-box protein [Burkholderia cenocepacia K56-2Valvano]ERI25026.1 PAS domain S-box protein [Burkholderia cenocepacia BC7]KKI82260.1 ATPase [Burkholderia cenocepacia]ONR51054.1 PAS domain-containing sensor histidine kinase [Burkholderia cenocepacia]